MNCPKCGFALRDFDIDCPRCQNFSQSAQARDIPPPDPILVELERQYRSAYNQMLITFWLGIIGLWPIWIWTLLATVTKNSLRLRVAAQGVEVQRWVDRVENRKPGSLRIPLWAMIFVVMALSIVAQIVLLPDLIGQTYSFIKGINSLMNGT